ncbi:MAG: tripartite tricarboxylate transporter TctB family protein [Desulfopila sp.]|jgi:hypothetical protein|nr:tripartite tricarboxylate transporter TctB family protein [Desulfopila sp.]
MKINYSLLFTCFILGVTAYLIYAAWDWPFETKFFPLAIAWVIVVLCIAQIAVDVFTTKNPISSKDQTGVVDSPVEEDLGKGETIWRILIPWLWLFGFIGSIWLIGFVLSIPLFILVYMLVQGRESFKVSFTWSIVGFVFTVGLFDMILHTHWGTPFWSGPGNFVMELIYRYISSGV